MRYRFAFAALLLALPATAQAMTVGEFLGKANALKARGILAMGSPDIKLLSDEMKTIAAAYRADLDAARTAGKPPHSCPPPAGSQQAKIGSKEFLAELEAIPVAQRGMSMKAAMYGIMKKRYPCKQAAAFARHKKTLTAPTKRVALSKSC